ARRSTTTSVSGAGGIGAVQMPAASPAASGRSSVPPAKGLVRRAAGAGAARGAPAYRALAGGRAIRQRGGRGPAGGGARRPSLRARRGPDRGRPTPAAEHGAVSPPPHRSQDFLPGFVRPVTTTCWAPWMFRPTAHAVAAAPSLNRSAEA